MPEPIIRCHSKLCGEEFPRRSLRCPKCSTIAVGKLYKYRRFDDRTLSILRYKKIYFPAAHKLNDPFEFDFRLTSSAVRGVAINTADLDAARVAMRSMGVLALSEVNDNILMWSHYADEHRGLCLEFTRSDSNELGNWDKCMPVLYSNELPAFEPLELEEPKAVAKVLTTKAEFWNYEWEWRILTHEGNKEFPLPGEITGVIFGFAMLQSNRDRIISLLGRTVEYFEASRSKQYFALDITPVAM